MIFCCIIILVAAVALQIMRIISGFQGASARACGSVGTCQSLTGAFFGIGANLEGGFLMLSEEVKSKYKKSIAQFSLMDDTFMAVVFGNELQLSEMLLHTIMGNDKIRVIRSTGQYAIKNLQGHSSTLDIFCQYELGRYFNVEVQRASSGAVPQRARYHLGMIDSKHFPAGVKDYSLLKDAYVIFITETDVLGGGLLKYDIKRVIAQNGQDFNDGSHIIYVNGEKRYDKNALSMLMHDFFCKDAKDIKNAVLADRVRHFKEEESGVEEMCEIMQKLANDAAYENSVKIAENFILAGLSIDLVVRGTQLPREEVEAIAKRLGKLIA